MENKNIVKIIIALQALTLIIASLCLGTMHIRHQKMMLDNNMRMHMMPNGQMMSGADHDMNQMMMDMVGNMKGKTGAELEKVFLEEMITHHQGAIDMAKYLQGKTDKPELEKMVNDIISVQNKEIEMMEKWLQDWF